MKVRNKKTGEIQEWDTVGLIDHNRISDVWVECGSIARLNEDWEDYEESKEFWFVDADGKVKETTYLTEDDKSNLKNFGNYFETKEEAEKAVEKLKAWKRLRDKGFKFEWWLSEPSSDHIEFYMDSFEWDNEATEDLNLLFESGDLEARNE